MNFVFRHFCVLIAIYFLSLGTVVAQEQGALIIDLEVCNLLNDVGSVERVGSGVEVSASLSSGNVLHTCSGDVTVSPDMKRSKIWTIENTARLRCDNPYDDLEGCLCYIAGTFTGTDDWHQVVTPSGKAKLVCHFND